MKHGSPGGIAWLATSASLLAMLPVGLMTHAAATTSGESCPAPESLVSRTTWQTHELAPGVELSDGTTRDDGGKGLVKMHVLRVDLTTPGLSVRPLMHSVAERSPLSQLAANVPNLVAAINTGYFDFETGAPTQPLIVGGVPLVVSMHRQHVVGFDSAGAMQAGSVHLSGDLATGSEHHNLDGVNETHAGGVVEYSSSWGAAPIPADEDSTSRTVVRDRLGPSVSGGSDPSVPENGDEIVARGRAAAWLASLPSGTFVNLSNTMRTSAPHPFAQAYGVGPTIVRNGIARTGIPCDYAGTNQPAQTAIAVTPDGKLVIGEVEEHPGTRLHGLDGDQMGAFMAQLGVDRSWLFDGSGSTEMLVRMPGAASLSMHTYPADGAERPMPVGLGITYQPPPPIGRANVRPS